MCLTPNIVLQKVISLFPFTSSSWVTVNYKTISLTLTVVAMARVATKRSYYQQNYALHYYSSKKLGIPFFLT